MTVPAASANKKARDQNDVDLNHLPRLVFLAWRVQTLWGLRNPPCRRRTVPARTPPRKRSVEKLEASRVVSGSTSRFVQGAGCRREDPDGVGANRLVRSNPAGLERARPRSRGERRRLRFGHSDSAFNLVLFSPPLTDEISAGRDLAAAEMTQKRQQRRSPEAMRFISTVLGVEEVVISSGCKHPT